ncbi:MAG TPA: ATP-dependent helicase [Acidimicrobiales bacterium]|nr:ATP-dependent helicase [Acidimicrobiales bacterium]
MNLDRVLDGLTESQRLAVFEPAEAVCVLAGAGSGKTRVLTLRVARRIRDAEAEADHTVVCTFTRKAAADLRARLRAFGVPTVTPAIAMQAGRSGPRRTGSGGAGGSSGDRSPAVTGSGDSDPSWADLDAGPIAGSGVRAGTLHQLALTLLRRRASDARERPPQLAENRFRLLTSLLGEQALASVADTEITWAKARCLSPDQYVASALAAGRSPGGFGNGSGDSDGSDGSGGPGGPVETIEAVADHYRAYEETLRRRGLIDLDDVLLRAHDLIEEDAGFADAVRWRYRHLSIDEFQDVNPAQYRLVQTILGARTDLFVVGDPNQAIYGWNGADPTLILRLPQLIPTIVVRHLDDNHRSTPQVVGAAVAALGSAATGTPRSTRPDGPVPVLRAFIDETAEAEGVVDSLQAWAASGRPWSEQAVLARTNDQLALVASALRRSGIPFRLAPRPEADTPAAPPPPMASAGRKGKKGDEAVELATFHRAKGLEWTSVCVIGLEDGLVPISHAATTEAWNEERRLLYVALTRASSDLCCTWALSRRSTASGRRSDREPSIWIGPITRACASMESQPARLDASKRIAQLRAGLGT